MSLWREKIHTCKYFFKDGVCVHWALLGDGGRLPSLALGSATSQLGINWG